MDNEIVPIVNSTFDLQRQELRQSYQNSVSSLNLPVDKQLIQLKDKYKLREFQLRREQLTDEDFVSKMQKLADKYEQDEQKIKQTSEMKLGEARVQLQQEFAGQMAEIDSEQTKILGSIDTMNYLVSIGKLPQEEADQELYKMVGIDYKPRTSQQQYQELDSYIKDLETELAGFSIKNNWVRKDVILFDPSGGYSKKSRKATDEEIGDYNNLIQQLAIARKQRGTLRNQIRGTQVRIGRLQNAFARKANKNYKKNRRHLRDFQIKKNTFVNKTLETGRSPTTLGAGVLQEKKKPTRQELRKLKTREAYELGKSLGYWN